MKVFWIIIALILTLVPGTARAIVAPDDLIIEAVTGYTDVLEDDDLLIVVKYDIVYAALPTELVSDAYIARFLRNSTDLNSTELFAFNDRGYNEGVFSFYWTASQRTTDSIEHGNANAESYIVRLQGKAGVFPGAVPSASTSAITWQARTALIDDVVALARALEGDADWVANSRDLITLGDKVQFTAAGAEYFATGIPRLSIMEPSLFESAVTVLLPVTRVPQNTYKTTLDNFWDGTFVETRVQSIADNHGLDFVIVTSFLAFLVMLIVCVGTALFLRPMSQANEFGIMTLAVTLPLAVGVGLISMAVGFTIGLIALIGVSWALFGRRGG